MRRITGILVLALIGWAGATAARAHLSKVRTTGVPEQSLRRVLHFQRLHATRVGSARQDLAPVEVPAVLKALAKVGTGFVADHALDIDAWRKKTKDHARGANALGRAVLAVSRAMAASTATNALQALGNELVAVTSTGAGDLYYWRDRAVALQNRVKNAAKKLNDLADTLAGAGGNREALPLAVPVNGLAGVLVSQDAHGSGEVDFWFATAEDQTALAKACGVALLALVPDDGEPVTTALREVASTLKGLTFSGTGNVQYWMQRVADLEETTNDSARALKELVQPR
jgi:hypothetical protein